MALFGYARVSTLDQDPALQHDALAAASCVRVFTDRASGALEERVELARVFDHAREGDTVVVWRLDRLGRSLRYLVDTITELERRGVGFRSLSESIDTTTPGGKLVFHIFAALAEFERDLIRERTRAGLDAARARGRNGGRPSVMTAEKLRVARELYDAREHTTAQIVAYSASDARRSTATSRVPRPRPRLAEQRLTAPPMPSSAKRVLSELSDQQRERALARHAVLRPHLESGVPLARATAAAAVPLRTAERWLASTARVGWRRSHRRRVAIAVGAASPTSSSRWSRAWRCAVPRPRSRTCTVRRRPRPPRTAGRSRATARCARS
jgi:DNA invertase Pin-like site-specific DNA recombinase